jgi:hypothetical protein
VIATKTQRGIAATKGGQTQTDKPIATKNTKKVFSHTVAFRALISATNQFSTKYNCASKETAAPIGALLITASTQRPFGVFCGNWIVGLGKSPHRESIRKKIRVKPRHLGFICVYLRPSAVRNSCQATLTAKDAKGAKLQSKEIIAKRYKGDGFF